MRKLDEIITRIEEEELYSGLESQELLSEAPLTEREAKKLFEQVRAKKEGKSKSKRHRKSKRLMILIAAAALLIGGITVGAATIAPMLNTWKPGDGQIGLSGGFGLEGLVAEKYLQNCSVIGTESTSGGITIKVGRVFVQGNVTIAELDVITPHSGAKASEAVEWENSNDWFPLFSFESPSAGYEGLMQKEDYFTPTVDDNSVSVFTGGRSGNILPREDNDPNDGVIPVWLFSTTHSYHLVNANYSLGVEGFSIDNISYLDGAGNRVDTKGTWTIEWPLESKQAENAIDCVCKEPIQLNETQTLLSYRASDTELALWIELSEKPGSKEKEAAYLPITVLRDGTQIGGDVKYAHRYMATDTVDTCMIVLMFPYPIDPAEIASIQYGSATIPVN